MEGAPSRPVRRTCTWKRILMRSSGAVEVFATAPAAAPATVWRTISVCAERADFAGAGAGAGAEAGAAAAIAARDKGDAKGLRARCAAYRTFV
jgi:hypothetical protein